MKENIRKTGKIASAKYAQTGSNGNKPLIDESYIDVVDTIVGSIGRRREHIIPILKAIQNAFGYLPEGALRRVCETTEIVPSDIEGVSTFYTRFRFSPSGRYIVRVCVGTACFVKGSDQIFDAFRRELEIPEGGDTDGAGLFTLEKAACLGCCMLAPAVQIDDVVYGYLTRRKVAGVLGDFLEEKKRETVESAAADSKERDGTGEIRMCTCTSCRASGAERLYTEFRREIYAEGLPVRLKRVGCSGASYRAPLAEVIPSKGVPVKYGEVHPSRAREILRRHFRPAGINRMVQQAADRLMDRLLTEGSEESVERYAVDFRTGNDTAYFSPQKRVVTEGSGSMDPLDLDEYLKNGGFVALKQCFAELPAEEIIDCMRRSGLRGRGGAGYPVWKKSAEVRRASGAVKYVICNADEGDPGAFMDRMILESFPYRIIEGMAVAAFAVGAVSGYIYIRSEYPLAVRIMVEAIRKCEEYNLLGESFSFSLEVLEGAGAFVCGEETALIAAIEGRRSMPRSRPPYPSERGLWEKPTLINNVETYANIPWIVKNGPAAFNRLGTPNSRGTKTFALAGKIIRGGLVEVPMGMTLREIVYEVGGGVQDGRALKAIQVGGPSGGCIPADLADLPVDYESLIESGAMMGSGGMVVLDETDCMVDIARYFMSFTQAESCGKCACGRIGTKRMLEILESLCRGTGTEEDIDTLEELGEVVKRGSLCGLGRTAPNPVLTTLRYFRREYIAHTRGRCPAGRCKALITYVISDECIGCTKCAQNCPVGAIDMMPYEKHEIDPEKCIRCGTCRQVCPEKAVRIE